MSSVYFWGRRETELHNTPKTQIIRAEINPFALTLTPKEFAEKIVEVKKNHPEIRWEA